MNNLLMMMLALFGQRLIQQTFTTSQTFTMPAGVTNLVTVSGDGSDGTASTITPGTRSVVTVNYHTSGSGIPGSNVQWDSLQSLTPAVADDLSDGFASWTRYTIQVYPDGTNTLTSNTTSVTCIEGTAIAQYTGDWQTSGPITSSGVGRVAYDVESGGAAGDPATGFGKTFPGGEVGAPAPTTTFNDVAVTPGNNYLLSIPTGGSITISYYG